MVLTAFLLAGRPVVPAYLTAQRDAIQYSAYRHGIQPEVLGAVFYNELLGQESHFLSKAIPGDSLIARTLRESLLGWHLLTLKQAQLGIKGLLALLGFNTTVGPTGIRPSVGREIQSEVTVSGGHYNPHGLTERPSLIRDLMNPPTAIEYLAANLERGTLRATGDRAGDWTVLARWHNTGLTAYRPGVTRALWDKGSRYVARVQEFLPAMSAVLDEPVKSRVDGFALITQWLASRTATHAATIHTQPAIIVMGAQ